MLVVADPVFHAKDDRWAKSDLASTPDGARTFTPMSSDSPGPDLKLERLAGAGRLASELTEMYGPETKVYTGLAARKGTVMKDIVPDLPNYTHIVFATHGMYDADLPGVLEPALALSMLPPGEDGFLRMTDVMSLKLNAQVTALTACRTGLGEFVSGEGVMSMGRAFQYAGSETVLMSLWSVEETASALLTAKFFEHLKEGKNRGDALQAARKDIRDRGYEHPFYWSAFILVGRAD
jgi:CHAT domain-containing protein